MIEAIAIGIAALGAVLLLVLFARIRAVDAELQLKKHRSKEAGLADLLIHAAVVDDGVIVGKNGSFMAGWIYQGDDNASSTEEQREAVSQRINQALSGEGAITAIDAIYASRPDGALLAPQHRWSLAVVSAGLDAAVNARANALTWPAHEGRYVRALIAELVAMAPYGYRVTTDTGTWDGSALLLAVANTRYVGGGMDLAPQADPTDGLLEVLRLDPVGRTHLLVLFRRLFRGTHLTDPVVHVERSRTVTIEALAERTGRDRGLRPPPHPFADGEPLAELPLRLEAVPDAVRLLLPAQS